MDVQIRVMQPAEVIYRKQNIISAYQDAFSPPPYEKTIASVAEFAGSLPVHTRRKGFLFLGAFGPQDELAGFSYGYTCKPGMWWADQVAKVIDGKAAKKWLDGSFQLVEIAVRPQWQGHGAGSRLHDHLLESVLHPRAVLSTLRAETIASRMYRRRGWQVLVESMLFPGTERPYRILGLELERHGDHREVA